MSMSRRLPTSAASTARRFTPKLFSSTHAHSSTHSIRRFTTMQRQRRTSAILALASSATSSSSSSSSLILPSPSSSSRHPHSTTRRGLRTNTVHQAPQAYLVRALLAGGKEIARLVSKAFMVAFNRESAEAKAQKASGQKTETSSVPSFGRRRMKLDDAKKVLGIDPVDEATKEPAELAQIINERYEKMYTLNAQPSGSFYLLSMLYNAKAVVEEDFKKKHGISLVPKKIPAQPQAEPAAEKAAPKP